MGKYSAMCLIGPSVSTPLHQFLGRCLHIWEILLCIPGPRTGVICKIHNSDRKPFFLWRWIPLYLMPSTRDGNEGREAWSSLETVYCTEWDWASHQNNILWMPRVTRKSQQWSEAAQRLPALLQQLCLLNPRQLSQKKKLRRKTTPQQLVPIWAYLPVAYWLDEAAVACLWCACRTRS